ncbi:MAG: hypothetical protein HFE77_04515 [Clostridiales bacterium]|nr:hypothetical protein [Clostridiales bacterium]
MKTFFSALCVFIVINGLLKTCVDEAKFSRYYGLLSGVLILSFVVFQFGKIDLPEAIEYPEQAYTESSSYETYVVNDAQKRLSALAEQQILEKLHIACRVNVSLRYENDMISVKEIEVFDTPRNGEIVYLLSQLFETEGGMIHFNG